MFVTQRNFKSGMEKYVSKHTTGTKICFERAIQLNSKHCYIIEKVKVQNHSIILLHM